MVRTLKAAESLAEGQDLEILNDRVPVFLRPVLRSGGLPARCTNSPPAGRAFGSGVGRSDSETFTFLWSSLNAPFSGWRV
ncbi:hypothetical protein [Caldinitratiruptor microaerophilus]|uniref:Uncharacterized protein n=1 Tax=Caldinitratiruptor microaerophilus TaxID=671077 RepID=A0AA35CIE8_9FIRM|nr:hypothetical protein caldi_07020 [Caldinitratiruptor microaerophilus]